MRILLVHNFYGSAAPSGENQVFDTEKAMLRTRGHEVTEFSRHSDTIRRQGMWGAVRGALATPWNPWMTSAINHVVGRFQPHVVHVHNTFPLISPGIFHAIGTKSARVLTLHNYRLFCPAGIPMRAGKVCTDCLEARSAWPSLQHGCYRNSRVATLPLAISVGLHRSIGTWSKEVDAFITLSEFQRQRMATAGLPLAKIHVKPNFYPGLPPVLPWHQRTPYVVFVGRLSSEKGVVSLLRAWKAWGAGAPELRMVGDGDLKARLQQMASGLPVRFLGQLSSIDAQAQISMASLLILPSECFEGFPMVVREAFAFGTPVAVSNIGPLPSIVTHGTSGVVFAPADPQSLLFEVRAAWETPRLLEQLAQGARAEFERRYTEATNYETLLRIYTHAVAASQGLAQENSG